MFSKSKATKKGANPKKENFNIDNSKQLKKQLFGHTKAVREIAYSVSYKVLISVGFDF